MLGICSITYEGSHPLEMVQRHVLDWRLQTCQDFKLFLCHDGPYTSRDKATPADIDFGPQVEVREFPIRRKAWGAYCRKDWLESIDSEQFSLCYFNSSDDQTISMFVETIMKEFKAAPDLQMLGFQSTHWHYGHKPIPQGVWPALSRTDWNNFVIKTDLAKKVGITDPEEYACDGIFMSACFGALDHDTSKMKILDNFLVVKN